MNFLKKTVLAAAMSVLATASYAETTLIHGEAGPNRGARAVALQWFADQVGERSDGDIKIDIQWGGALFKAKALRATDIMTPRPVVYSLPAATTVAEVLEQPDAMRFSRIPVWGMNSDEVLGYVLKDDILLRAARDEHSLEIGDLVRELIVVKPELIVPDLLERLLEKNEHIALVVDQFGGVQGVVSMEDVLETVLGAEIVDEADATGDMRLLARKRWFERARRLGIASDDALEALRTP